MACAVVRFDAQEENPAVNAPAAQGQGLIKTGEVVFKKIRFGDLVSRHTFSSPARNCACTLHEARLALPSWREGGHFSRPLVWFHTVDLVANQNLRYLFCQFLERAEYDDDLRMMWWRPGEGGGGVKIYTANPGRSLLPIS